MAKGEKLRERLTDSIRMIEEHNYDFDITILCKEFNIDNIDDFEKYLTNHKETSSEENVAKEIYSTQDHSLLSFIRKAFKPVIFFKEKNYKVPYKEIEKIEYGFSLYKKTISREYEHNSLENCKLKDNFLCKTPPLSLLKKISEFLGINNEWLQRGNGHPFRYKEFKISYPGECLEFHNKLSPQKYYFVLSDNPEKEVAIILQLSDYKFITLPKTWHLNPDYMGRGGQRQLENLCYFIKKLKTTLTQGKKVEDKLFRKLAEGSIYPGIIAYGSRKYKIQNSYWQDDITDIKHQYPIAVNYKNYGDWFLEAQKTIAFIREENLAFQKE